MCVWSSIPTRCRSCPLPPRTVEHAIAFSGNFDYHPNQTAVSFFAREIWPLLRARHPRLVWRLIGKNVHAVSRMVAHDSRIEHTGPVPDAVAELARARIAVVPLLSAGGTRLKILEAWAAGVPVVSTTIGSEGLSAVHGENILLADTAVDILTAIERLLADESVGARIAAAGRRVYETEYTWESVWSSLNL